MAFGNHRVSNANLRPTKDSTAVAQIPQAETGVSSALTPFRYQEGLIGEILVRLGYMSQSDGEIVLSEQKMLGGKFGEVAIRLGVVTEREVSVALANQAHVEFCDLRSVEIDYETAVLIPYEECQRLDILPLYTRDNKIYVALASPNDISKRDAPKRLLSRQRKEIVIVGVEESELMFAHSRVFEELSFRKQVRDYTQQLFGTHRTSDVTSAEDRAMIPKLVSAIIHDALATRASDIHMVQSDDAFRIFYRADGDLQYIMTLPPYAFAKVAAQIKQKCGLEPGDRLHTLDGSWNFISGNRMINIRVSKIPTIPAQQGESLVLRILDRNRVNLDLKSLGFLPEVSAQIEKICHMPHGMILCTGPTGSGKTTTLYSMLSTRSPFDTNILTVENPVEYQMPGVRQVQVNEKADVTFASALRSFLRQDPDVILVGEIRDHETAEIAVNAALTGHLVLSTLHTNDAIGAIPRLLDFKIEPTLLRSSLTCIVAQRLVKKLCTNCRILRDLYADELEAYVESGLEPPQQIYEANQNGCPSCRRGYTSPTVIYEVLTLDDDMRDLIGTNASEQTIFQTAMKSGMKPLFSVGLEKVSAGLTTLSEVYRVAKRRKIRMEIK
jgi:type IV pilus assembly protein PilB